ncbi:hypothetical protein V1515DRAFT_613448 [Lipomyces mesembrius]
MEDRPRPPLRRSVSAGRHRLSYDDSSVHTASPVNDRGVRKSPISNIYKPTSPNTTPVTVTPPSRRGRGTQGRPVSSTDHGNRNSSARKSTVTNASRHSDGSGISIRFSIAPRPSGSAYRSFSGASDILPGTPRADDANSDVVDYDEIAPGIAESAPQFPLPISQAPQDEIEQIEFENDNDAGDANVVRRGYMGIPGFYYDNYSSNYNSSEEDPDDSSVSDVFGARPSSPVDVDIVDEIEYHDILGVGQDKKIQQDDDHDDHARLIEVDANGNCVTRRPNEYNGFGYKTEIDMDGSDYNLDYANTEESQHIPDFDQDNDQENVLRWSQTEADTNPSSSVIHPPVQGPGEIAATFDFVYRVRDIIPEEDVRARQAQIRAGIQRPKRALIPVYSDGLSLSTFPYVNSLAPISTIVRQQPRGHYATTVVGARDSTMSTILPPMPTQPPVIQTGINAVVGQHYGRTEFNHQNKAERLAEEVVDYSQLEAQARWEDEEQVDLDDPLEILRQLRLHQQEAWNDSMFTFQMQQNSPPTIPRERRPCSKSMARLLLAVFICFPPLWLVMGFGGLDIVVGEIPQVERMVAKVMGASIFVAVIIGLGVGLGVGF